MRSSAGPKRWFWELLQNAVDTISDYDDKMDKPDYIDPVQPEIKLL